LISFSVKNQIIHAFPYYALSAFSGAVLWILPDMKSDMLTLIVYIPVFIAIYLAGAFMFKLNAYLEVKSMIKNIIKKHRK